MSLFDINYRRLAEWLLPVKLRQSRMKAFVVVMITPVMWLYRRFWANRLDNLYKVRHGQYVAHLEAVLNDKWDAGFRRIRVVDGDEDFYPVYLFRGNENRPAFLFRELENKPMYLYTDEEVLHAGVDFIVNVPATIPFDMQEMISLVNFYKMPGKGFRVVVG